MRRDRRTRVAARRQRGAHARAAGADRRRLDGRTAQLREQRRREPGVVGRVELERVPGTRDGDRLDQRQELRPQVPPREVGQVVRAVSIV
jgi:hypothetical protein